MMLVLNTTLIIPVVIKLKKWQKYCRLYFELLRVNNGLAILQKFLWSDVGGMDWTNSSWDYPNI